MAFATNDEDFTQVATLYANCSADDKNWLHDLVMDERGWCFEGKDNLASHFSGLTSDDLAEIKSGLTERFPHLMWATESMLMTTFRISAWHDLNVNYRFE